MNKDKRGERGTYLSFSSRVNIRKPATADKKVRKDNLLKSRDNHSLLDIVQLIM